MATPLHDVLPVERGGVFARERAGDPAVAVSFDPLLRQGLVLILSMAVMNGANWLYHVVMGRVRGVECAAGASLHHDGPGDHDPNGTVSPCRPAGGWRGRIILRYSLDALARGFSLAGPRPLLCSSITQPMVGHCVEARISGARDDCRDRAHLLAASAGRQGPTPGNPALQDLGGKFRHRGASKAGHSSAAGLHRVGTERSRRRNQPWSA